jgi:hypothetical protein
MQLSLAAVGSLFSDRPPRSSISYVQYPNVKVLDIPVPVLSRPAGVGDTVTAIHFPPVQTLPAQASATLVYFHGNGDQLAWGPCGIGSLFAGHGFDFYAIEYPG